MPADRFRHHILTFLVLCLAGIMAVMTGPALSRAGDRDQTLTIALDTQPLSIIPSTASGVVTASIGTQIFSGLLLPVSDPARPFEPLLATSWAWNDDHNVLTFDIRENALFHDNRPVTVEDVAFSIDFARAFHPYGTVFSLIRKTVVLDRHRIGVEFIHPVPSLLLLFTANFIPILPRHVYERFDPTDTVNPAPEPVGSGPFRAVEIEPGKTYRLRRFDGYFIPGQPCLAGITFKVFEDPEDLFSALKWGEVDLIGFLHSFEQALKFRQIPGVVTLESGYDQLGVKAFLCFNMKDPRFKDIRVRQALSHAIDTAFIRKHILKEEKVTLTGPFLSTSPFYTQGADVTYPLDIEKANRLLDEAGYPRNEGGKRFSIRVEPLPNNRQLFIPMLEYLRHSLARSVGVELSFSQSVTLSQWAHRVASGDFEAALDYQFSWSDPLIGTHRNYHSKNIRTGKLWANMTQYNNPKVDRLLDLASRTVSFTERKALYAKVQHAITRDAPSVWLGTIPFITVYRRNMGRRLVNLDRGRWGLLSTLDQVCWKAESTNGN